MDLDRKDLGQLWHRLTRTDLTVLAVLIDMPLASAADIAEPTRIREATVHRALNTLLSLEVVSSVSLGATRSRVTRWHLTGEWAERLDATWHEEWALARLLERLPLAEWFYPAAGRAGEIAVNDKRMGKVLHFRWFKDTAWDAAARYEKGWVAFCWSGLLESATHLRDRLRRLGPDLMEHTLAPAENPGPGWAWPGVMVFVVPDQWQRQVVYDVTDSFAFRDQVQVWCVADGSVEGPARPVASRKWVGQGAWPVNLGGWTFKQRLESSLWSELGAITNYRLLLAAAEWRWTTSKFARLYCRVLGDPTSVKRALKDLVDRGYLGRVKQKNQFLYFITARGIDRLSRMDWIFGRDIPAAVQGSARDAAVMEHDRQNLEMMARFMGKGLTIANGWRYQGGRIAPDGIVYLKESPYGPGWHLEEYERSARGPSGAGRKLRNYTAVPRRRAKPVLFATRDTRMEQHLQTIGQSADLKLITITFKRLKSSGGTGDTGCWSMYGEQVSLG